MPLVVRAGGTSVKITSRAEWGARAPRSRSTVSWGTRTEFVVHYSEGPTSQSPRSIQDFHMDGNGWSDIGYNFLVDVQGRVYEGRGWLTVGAHAPDHNSSGIGVCMIGRNGDATPAALRSIRAVYDEAVRRKGGGLKKLGHRDVYSTSCPGDELYAWVRAGMPAPGGGDDMPLTKDDAKLIADAVWRRDEIPAPDGNPKNATWWASSHLVDQGKRLREISAKVSAQGAAIGELSKAVAALAADGGDAVDVDALIARIEAAIESVTVRLDVPDQT